MRIVVVTAARLFETNEQIAIAGELVAACRRLGHETDMVVLPRPRLGAEFRSHLAAWLTDLSRDASGHRVDRLISLAYPAYALRHPHHVAWLGTRNSAYYEEWPQTVRTLAFWPRLNARFHRYIMTNFDNYFLQRNVERVFAQTPVVAATLDRYHHLDEVPVLTVPAAGAPAWNDIAAELLKVKPSLF